MVVSPTENGSKAHHHHDGGMSCQASAKLLVLLGPSGTGKSSMIGKLKSFDRRYSYISPYVTRPLRAGEVDKMTISREELLSLQRNEGLLAVNEVYGALYGTPRDPIELAFREGIFPVLDWPIDRLDILEQAFPGRLYRVYIEPPSTGVLWRHLQDGRDPNEERFRTALAELAAIRRGVYERAIDLRIVNPENCLDSTARRIHAHYLVAVGASV